MVQPEHPTFDGTARTSYLWWYSQNILPVMVQPEHPTCDGTARTSYLWRYSQNILPVTVQPEHPTCDGTARTSYLWWYSQNILSVMVQPEHPTCDGAARTSYLWWYSQNILPVMVQPEHPTCECKYLYCPSTFADQALATTVRWTISENIVPLRYAALRCKTLPVWRCSRDCDFNYRGTACPPASTGPRPMPLFETIHSADKTDQSARSYSRWRHCVCSASATFITVHSFNILRSTLSVSWMCHACHLLRFVNSRSRSLPWKTQVTDANSAVIVSKGHTCDVQRHAPVNYLDHWRWSKSCLIHCKNIRSVLPRLTETGGMLAIKSSGGMKAHKNLINV